MSSPEIRFTHYDAATVAEVAADLAHLESIAGSVIGTPPVWEPLRPWQATELGALRDGTLQVTTVALSARLAGYAAGHVADGRITIDALVVAPTACCARPGLPAALVNAFIDAADTPWADVVLPRDPRALASLMADGWDPVPQTSRSVAGAVVLRGASTS